MHPDCLLSSMVYTIRVQRHMKTPQKLAIASTKQVQAANRKNGAKRESTGREPRKTNHEAGTSTKPPERSQKRKYRQTTAQNEPRSRYKQQTARTEINYQRGYLVGGIPTPLKNMSQLGLLSPIYGKIKFMFQTTNQISFYVWWLKSL